VYVLNKIKVVGLGPGGKRYLTLEAIEIIREAKKLYFRTLKHPVIEHLDMNGQVVSFDNEYEENEEFDGVYSSIVDRLIQYSQEEEEVVYCIPGNPFVAEKTVELLQEKFQGELEFIHGVSFVDIMITTLRKDPVNGLQIIDGLDLDRQIPNPNMDNIVIQAYNPFVVSSMKLKLMKYYDDDHKVYVVRGAGIPGEEVIYHTELYNIDRVDNLDHLTSLYIPKTDEKKKYNYDDLREIVASLRGENGCPWDKKQDYESLMPGILEEAYEVIEAIKTKDFFLLEEELGDLLLQIVFYGILAEEDGYFNDIDITTGICNKLINRHPHVFGDVNADSAEEVLVNWEKIKSEEKNESRTIDSIKRISKTLPALTKAYKIQKKAADVGFDWDEIKDVIKKIHEELEELQEVIGKDQTLCHEELGDLLFSVVNLSRFLKINPELALMDSNDKFVNRFEFVEEKAIEKYGKIEGVSLSELDEFWNLAKKSI
jgi:tetrapyrrole methylase family protein/MazG family protein